MLHPDKQVELNKAVLHCRARETKCQAEAQGCVVCTEVKAEGGISHGACLERSGNGTSTGISHVCVQK